MFKKIIQAYKKFKESELQRKKMYLFEKTKEHYYQELLKFPLSGEGKGEGKFSIPDFVMQEQFKKLAYALATKELRTVIAECRVNECYKNCVKYHRGLTVNA